MRKFTFLWIMLAALLITACQQNKPPSQQQAAWSKRASRPTFTPTSSPRPVHTDTPPVVMVPTMTPTTTPTVDPKHCAPHPCPSILGPAVDGCFCGKETYRAGGGNASYCCAGMLQKAPCPEMLAAQKARIAFFGGPSRSALQRQMVQVHLQGYPIWVHIKARSAFEQVNAAISALNYRIREPVGSWVWRDIAGTSVLSTHAFGIAVDINPSTNPRCGVTNRYCCYFQLVTDMPPAFVQAFKDAGFIWGGDWSEHPDPMHFEWHGWQQQTKPTVSP